MKEFKQTWWDKHLPTKLHEFESWVGDSDSESKVIFRRYIKSKGYKSLIDLGCGNATEYFAYKAEYPELKYLGIDSSEFLYKLNTDLGVPMMIAEADKVPLRDNHYDVVFSRHVLEHQPDFASMLAEMIRLADKEAIHIFFIKPREKEIIHYDEANNLYHNTYCRADIEVFLASREDVQGYGWIPLNETEIALSIMKKSII
jgi:ubiquinone/menaquinone biosynthesis C-methylase UbiE